MDLPPVLRLQNSVCFSFQRGRGGRGWGTGGRKEYEDKKFAGVWRRYPPSLAIIRTELSSFPPCQIKHRRTKTVADGNDVKN